MIENEASAVATEAQDPPPAATSVSEVDAENMPLKPLSDAPSSNEMMDIDLDMLMEVPVKLSVEIGTNTMPIKELAVSYTHLTLPTILLV